MKVKYFPCQPHCFAFGGFDLQMLNTLDAVIKAGVEASRLDIWSRDNDFDIIHLWGVGPYNYHLIDWAKKAGKKIIATVLSPYYDTFKSKLGFFYRHFFPDYVGQLIHYYQIIDKIIVLNNLQLNVLNKYYRVPASKMEIIPNIIEDKYFEIPKFNFKMEYGIDNYVLCVGNICPRKNQYNLALACINLNANLVIIGNLLDGELTYGKQLETIIANHKNIWWIRELPKASEELVSAYYNCSVYALPSKEETQPISALEAIAMRKPMVLIDRAYAHQSFYQGAILSKSSSVKNIETALKRAMTMSVLQDINPEILNCKEKVVGEKYKMCYVKLLQKNL